MGPAEKEKLVIVCHSEPGGACWDKTTYSLHFPFINQGHCSVVSPKLPDFSVPSAGGALYIRSGRLRGGQDHVRDGPDTLGVGGEMVSSQNSSQEKNSLLRVHHILIDLLLQQFHG